MFATSNLLLNVLLARWVSPEEYGAFAVAFAVFLLVGSLHQAALLEPMLVFGPGTYKDRLPRYLGALVYGHLVFVLLGGVALLAVGLVLWLADLTALSRGLLALAVTEPFILLLWFMRRACYVRVEPRLAASGGALYSVLMIFGACGLYWEGWLSAPSTLGVMAVSSLVVSLWLAVRLGIKLPRVRGGVMVREVLGSHLKYGRWSVANQVFNWVPLNIAFLILPIFGGLAAVASYKALMNLTMPVLQGVWALSILLLPILVRARNEGEATFDAKVRSALVIFVLGPVAYWLLLGLFHGPLMHLFYGGRYLEYAGLLWLLGLAPILAAVKQVMGHALRALERPDWLFWAYALSAGAAVTAGTALVYLWGVTGAALMLPACLAITAVFATAFYRRLRGSPASRTWQAPVRQETG